MKAALFAFNGDPMCFVHVLLNALDLKEKGYEVKVVVEGSATKLIRTFHEDENAPFAPLYRKCKEAGLFDGTCKACTAKMGATEAAEAEGFTFLADMSGHPSVSRYMQDGYQIITF